MKINGAEIHCEEDGKGRETIVFAHGLLFSGRMFESQVMALKGRYRCVTFDFRGQGRSEVTASGYDMDTLAEDAAGLIEALGCAPCHFVGLSMGGFVGMRLAARRPALLKSLVLLETTAQGNLASPAARQRSNRHYTSRHGRHRPRRRLRRDRTDRPTHAHPRGRSGRRDASRERRTNPGEDSGLEARRHPRSRPQLGDRGAGGGQPGARRIPGRG